MTLALPVDSYAIIGVVPFGIAPIVADLVGQRILVQLDAQPRFGGQLHESIFESGTALSGTPRPELVCS
jgi:hypothetical protein